MSPHTASQKYSIDWRHVFFPASSPSLSPLQGLQPWQFSQTRAAKKNPCWQLHFMASSTSILSLVFGDEAANGAKSEWSSIGPAFVELRRWRERWRLEKFQHTPADREGHLFSFDALSSRTLKLKKAPLHYFHRPCHHLKVALPWFSSALRFSIVVSCNLQAEATVTGHGRTCAEAWSISKEDFFFGIFGKSYARGRRETKKIITVA